MKLNFKTNQSVNIASQVKKSEKMHPFFLLSTNGASNRNIKCL